MKLKKENDTKTFHLMLLSLISGGIYYYMWAYRLNHIMYKTTRKKVVGDSFLIWPAVAAGLGWWILVFEASVSNSSELNPIGILASLLEFGMLAGWSFKMRDSLQAYALTEMNLDLKMNRLYTLFLRGYYINYCINALGDMEKKRDILSPASS